MTLSLPDLVREHEKLARQHEALARQVRLLAQLLKDKGSITQDDFARLMEMSRSSEA